MTDEQIIDLYWNRKEEAIACTDYNYGNRLLNIAGRILESREDSEECVSDTYLKAWQTIPPQRPTFVSYTRKLAPALPFPSITCVASDTPSNFPFSETTADFLLCPNVFVTQPQTTVDFVSLEKSAVSSKNKLSPFSSFS